MDAGDDVSDSASMYSVDRSVMSARQRAGTGASKGAAEPAKKAKNDVHDDVIHRPVSSLKPKVSRSCSCCWFILRVELDWSSV